MGDRNRGDIQECEVESFDNEGCGECVLRRPDNGGRTLIGFTIIVVLILFVLWGMAKNLNEPTPIYNNRGQIVGFETPDGEVEAGTPAFNELVSSYRSESDLLH